MPMLPLAIDRRARHPAVEAVRRVRALLVQRDRAVAVPIRNSYQRTPPPPADVLTECTATIDSRSPIRRYTRRAMILSPCASSRRSVPGCGTQLVSWPSHR